MGIHDPRDDPIMEPFVTLENAVDDDDRLEPTWTPYVRPIRKLLMDKISVGLSSCPGSVFHIRQWFTESHVLVKST